MNDEQVVEIILKKWKEFCRFKVSERSSDDEWVRFRFHDFMEWLKDNNK